MDGFIQSYKMFLLYGLYGPNHCNADRNYFVSIILLDANSLSFANKE